MTTAPSLVYAQDPFTFGNTNDPFSFNSGGTAHSNSNTTLQIRSNTDWSGSYGDSTGSTTVDGHGDKDISFSCSNTYSADFQKKGEGPGFLTLNIVQPFNNTLTKVQDVTKHGIPLLIGRSLNLTKQITDLHDNLEFSVAQDTNSSSNAVENSNSLNTTLIATIIDPNGHPIYSDNSSGVSIDAGSGLKPYVPGKYTFGIKNLGNSTIDLGIDYGSFPSQTTITTQNVTNTRTTTAQFGTVSVSGSC